MDGTLRLIVGAAIAVRRIFGGGLTGGDEGGGCKISERTRKMKGRRRY